MKKILCFVLSVFILMTYPCPVMAKENTEMFAYTINAEEFDEYVSDKIFAFLYGHYGYFDNDLEVGQGINIINNNDYPKVLYPIWKNNQIVATFIVANIDGTYTGTLSNKTYLLNDLKQIASSSNPIFLMSNENGFFAITKDYEYNMCLNELIGVTSNKDYEMIDGNYTLANLSKKIDYARSGSLARGNANSIFDNGWQVYYYDTNHSVLNHCYTFCLYNIFRNLGINDYTFNNIRSAILNGSGVANLSKIKEWLDDENIDYTSNSSYLSYSNVYNILCTNDNYLMIGLKYSNGSTTTQRHFMAMYGCASVGGNVIYKVWDPESHEAVPSSQGLLTIDGSTRQVVNAEQVTLTWNDGYVGNFSK